ncbi:hypothetical protein Tco_0970054 [Tanacetum coccineum]
MEQESSKKHKVEEDKESEDLKKCLEIVPDDGDDVTIDATPLSIKSPTIVEENLEVLWSIVIARFKKTELVNYMDNLLLHNLKTMFEHHVEDNSMLFYLLVEKIYPLTNHTLHQMFIDVKLQVDYECEMAFELRRLVKKHLKEGYGRIVGIKSLLKVAAAKVCVTAAKLKYVVGDGVLAREAPSSSSSSPWRDEIHGYDGRRSRKVDMIWSFGFLGVCKRTKILFVCEYGLDIEWNSKDLTEFLKGKSDEFVLNHEGDKNDARVISLKSDLTIKI